MPTPNALPCAAALARTLADTLLAHVHSATALNVAAARALLRHARITPPPSFTPRTEAWLWAWRSFEVCATSADQIVGLVRGQVDRSTEALWRQAERWIDELEAANSTEATHEVRTAFAALQRAQQACWEATQQAHGALLSWAQQASASRHEPLRDPGSVPGSVPARVPQELAHGAH